MELFSGSMPSSGSWSGFPPPAGRPVQRRRRGATGGRDAGHTPMITRSGAAHRRLRRPGHRLGREPPRGGLGARAVPGRRGGGPGRAVPDAGPLAGAFGRRDRSGRGCRFSARIAALPFSAGTSAAGASGPLLDAGHGDSLAFAGLSGRARGAWLLIEQDELKDINGLFAEYARVGRDRGRAWRAGALGVVYMGSRPNNLLYRHNMNLGFRNRDHLGVVMERDAALRALRLLRAACRSPSPRVLDLQPGACV